MIDLNENRLEETGKDESELGKKTQDAEQLSEEDLNTPIDEHTMPDLKSCDCRSECKYVTGYGHKYANFGYSG